MVSQLANQNGKWSVRMSTCRFCNRTGRENKSTYYGVPALIVVRTVMMTSGVVSVRMPSDNSGYQYGEDQNACQNFYINVPSAWSSWSFTCISYSAWIMFSFTKTVTTTTAQCKRYQCDPDYSFPRNNSFLYYYPDSLSNKKRACFF